MNRMNYLRVTGLVICILFVQAAAAKELLLETRTSWDGGALAYPQGPVQISSFILRLEEGDQPRFHCHPVPTMGYVLKGRIKVETRDGNTATFQAGQSVVEVMRTMHRGTAVDAPVEICSTMRYLMYHDVYGQPEEARELFRKLPASARRLRCVSFSGANAACPHGVDVSRHMARAAEVLA